MLYSQAIFLQILHLHPVFVVIALLFLLFLAQCQGFLNLNSCFDNPVMNFLQDLFSHFLRFLFLLSLIRNYPILCLLPLLLIGMCSLLLWFLGLPSTCLLHLYCLSFLLGL